MNSKTIILFLFFVMFTLSNIAFAAYSITGVVNDTANASANGRTVNIYYVNDTNNTASDVIGPTGSQTPPDNVYIIDAEAIPDHPSIEVGNVIVAEVPDNGDGYIAGPVNVTVSGSGLDIMPDMMLFCGRNDTVISVITDDVYYLDVNTNSTNIIISGKLYWNMCKGIANRTIAIKITKSDNTTFGIDQSITNVNGSYSSSAFTVDNNSGIGTYTVFVAGTANGTVWNSTTFEVTTCPDADNDTYFDAICGGLDCDDSNAGINPDAAEVCDGIDNNCDGIIDESFDIGVSCSVGVGACLRSGTKVCTQDGSGTECNAVAGSPTTETCNSADDDCDGQTDEGNVCGGGGGGGGAGGASSCTSDWVCDEWSECVDGTQTRTCTDTNNCGTTAGKPDLSQSCTETVQAGAVCGNDIIESGEECDGGTRDCDAAGYPGTQTCTDECVYSVCASDKFCGDNICNGPETADTCSDCAVAEEEIQNGIPPATGLVTGSPNTALGILFLLIAIAAYAVWHVKGKSISKGKGRGRGRKGFVYSYKPSK